MIRTISSWMLLALLISPNAVPHRLCDFSSAICACVGVAAVQPAATPAMPVVFGEDNLASLGSGSDRARGVVVARLEGVPAWARRCGGPAYGSALHPADPPGAIAQQSNVLRI
jgi:hypothetical protein